MPWFAMDPAKKTLKEPNSSRDFSSGFIVPSLNTNENMWNLGKIKWNNNNNVINMYILKAATCQDSALSKLLWFHFTCPKKQTSKRLLFNDKVMN